MGRVILLSGGLDSIAMCEMRRSEGMLSQDLLLQFIYCHPAMSQELNAVNQYRTFLHQNGCFPAHREVNLPIDAWEMNTSAGASGPRVVPLRNACMLIVGARIAVTNGMGHVAIGAVSDDGSQYMDCRPSFFADVNKVTDPFGVRVFAPLSDWSKTEVKEWMTQNAPEALGFSWSCYQPASDGSPCGACDSCRGGQ